MEGCIFCMIASGEIEARVVYEDDRIIAFDDLSPQGPVHVLVIPKEHHASLGDDVPEDLLGALFAAIPRVAAAKGVTEGGYRVVVNSGPDAGQSVAHLHVHVIGGAPMSHGMVRFEPGRPSDG